MTVKFRSCSPIALNFVYFLRFVLPLKSPSRNRLRVHLAIVEPDFGLLFSILSRVNSYTIIRVGRDFYERYLKVRRASFRRHKESRCSPRTKELSYVSRKTFSLCARVCVCMFQGGIFSWVFSSTDNDGLINELPTSWLPFHLLLFENDEYTVGKWNLDATLYFTRVWKTQRLL